MPKTSSTSCPSISTTCWATSQTLSLPTTHPPLPPPPPPPLQLLLLQSLWGPLRAPVQRALTSFTCSPTLEVSTLHTSPPCHLSSTPRLPVEQALPSTKRPLLQATPKDTAPLLLLLLLLLMPHKHPQQQQQPKQLFLSLKQHQLQQQMLPQPQIQLLIQILLL